MWGERRETLAALPLFCRREAGVKGVDAGGLRLTIRQRFAIILVRKAVCENNLDTEWGWTAVWRK